MKRIFALLLSASLTLAIALPVTGENRPQGEEMAALPSETGQTVPEGLEETEAGLERPGAEGAEEVQPDGEGGGEEAAEVGEGDAAPEVMLSAQVRNAANDSDTLRFENLRASLTRYNENILSLQGQMQDLNSVTTEGMWESIVGLSRLKNGVDRALAALDPTTLDPEIYIPLSTSLTAQSALLQIQIASLQGQRTSLGDSTESAKNSLNDGINQIIKGAETLYIAIVTMEDGMEAIERGLETLNRAVAIVEKQRELGMASDYDVEQMRYQRSQLQSQLQGLKFQITSNKITLEGMCGMELKGAVKLGALPMPTEEQLDAVDYDKLLSLAMGRNTAVMNAQISYNSDSSGTNQHALAAARTAFAASFKGICLAVGENRRLVETAGETVAFRQRSFAIAEKKYELGMASYEEYLAAQNDLASAQDDLRTARRNLFSAYLAYTNATQYGLA